jgi:hypothetical protein
MDIVDQELVVKEIGMFAMELVASLQDIKAERDDANRPLDSDALLVLLAQLVKLRTDVFIQ